MIEAQIQFVNVAGDTNKKNNVTIFKNISRPIKIIFIRVTPSFVRRRLEFWRDCTRSNQQLCLVFAINLLILYELYFTHDKYYNNRNYNLNGVKLNKKKQHEIELTRAFLMRVLISSTTLLGILTSAPLAGGSENAMQISGHVLLQISKLRTNKRM